MVGKNFIHYGLAPFQNSQPTWRMFQFHLLVMTPEMAISIQTLIVHYEGPSAVLFIHHSYPPLASIRSENGTFLKQ